MKKLGFLALFTILALISQSINFSQLVGQQNQFFTFFQLIGPLPAQFLGAGFGVIAVLAAELINFVIVGKQASAINLLRLLPMVFAALYFATVAKNKFSSLVAVTAIIVFLANPIGASAPLICLLWLIPVGVQFFFKNNLLAKSFGATWTAHAIGGALWVWFVPTTSAYWTALIPIALFERTVFALGIAGSYVAFNYALSLLPDKLALGSVSLDKKYSAKTR